MVGVYNPKDKLYYYFFWFTQKKKAYYMKQDIRYVYKIMLSDICNFHPAKNNSRKGRGLGTCLLNSLALLFNTYCY